jgi:lipopolysaccharide transport system ATP-binding protein
LGKGKYKTTMNIPGNFLNESTYKISAFLVPEDVNLMAIMPEVLEFSIIDTGAMRKEYTGKWIGQIRPKMSWSTEKLS